MCKECKAKMGQIEVDGSAGGGVSAATKGEDKPSKEGSWGRCKGFRRWRVAACLRQRARAPWI